MANCSKCAYSTPYWNVRTRKSESRCIAGHDYSMATKEGEHDCQAFKVNEFDEERIDVIGQNGPNGLHYEEIKDENDL
jgi:hypothetical protein